MTDSPGDFSHYTPQEILIGALELAGLKTEFELLGKSFIFSDQQTSDSVILFGTVVGVQLVDAATIEIFVSTPYFHHSKLRSLVHFKKKEWFAQLTTGTKTYKGTLEIIQ